MKQQRLSSNLRKLPHFEIARCFRALCATACELVVPPGLTAAALKVLTSTLASLGTAVAPAHVVLVLASLLLLDLPSLSASTSQTDQPNPFH